ncbi:hypothetical protein SAMN02799624_04708 [Paenibacillus sp. UNC496MF]|uniref:hypothetical protein n=1 Tax=Paenibacillus sp. UNC496MF TaxID=1502753 RepID=UPI0008F4111E|nr:hypothetical protein [Paenibacillus sp. UNC496MF]SFJ49032.1 hypothetical protein SAMN02799624_04708 [Paenibacillus sp. UNC496MF]
MERSSLKLMAAAMLISVMLSGCGAKDDSQSGGAGQAANGANAGQAAAQGADGGANGLQQPDRTADYFAKVVRVSGDAIVVQKSTTSPADMPSFGGGRGGQRPQGGDGAQGQGGQGGGQRGHWQGGGKTNGDGAQGQTPDGQAGNGQDAAAGGQNGGGQSQGQGRAGGGRFGGGGFMNAMKFEDAQTTVPVNADTRIVKFGRGQNGMTTDALKATDLQAGDVLMVWLAADNKTAGYIRLQFNPADMGSAGKAGNGQ